MDGSSSYRFFNRGPSPAARWVFFTVLSVALLFVDAHNQYLERVRMVLAVIIYPLQRLAGMPGAALRDMAQFLSSQATLVRENAELREQRRNQAADLMQLQALQAENRHLRQLLELREQRPWPMVLAEIVHLDRDVFRRRLMLDKGSLAGLQEGQVVIDDRGVVGQVTRVYPFMSEVTQVTDKDHPVPVQLLRNGLRAVVFGAGNVSDLVLRYMPVSADIVEGDVLVTSGIDGTYPPNIPVAVVKRIERDPAYPFARIVCAPLAGVDQHRQLLVITAPAGQFSEHVMAAASAVPEVSPAP